ncbi:MAG: NAD(P)H-binding protein [Actinomycetota bacterium]|nr:NAD(P)H-binding protein [Actinomycetota bacterium]
MTLAVTGSTGRLGARVVALLGDAVGRLVVRDAGRAPHLPWAPEVTVAAYGDGDAARAALAGVDLLLMVSAAESSTRRQEHRSFVEAAAAAGVGHVVYTSFARASPDALFTLGRDHADTEAAIRASRMRFTILRDCFYTDVLTLFADGQGVIRGPAGQGRVALVTRDDVADAVVAVLRDPGAHDGATYTLTGPEAVTLTEATSRMSTVLGRCFRYEDQTLEQAYASRRQWSQEQWQLDAWVSTYTAIRDGEVAEVTGDVERLTGHAASPLEAALRP